MLYMYKVTYRGKRIPTLRLALGADSLSVGLTISSKRHMRLMRKYGKASTTVYKLI